MWAYLINKIFFSLKSIVKNVSKSLLASFGILLLIAFIVFYLSFRTSIKNYVSDNLLGSLAINEIIISPKTRPGKDVFSPAVSPQNRIRIKDVKAIRQMEEFSEVHSIIRSNYTSKLAIEFMGKEKAPYVPICGIEKEFLKGKVKNWQQFRYSKKKKIPLIAPKMAIQSLNNYTAVKGLPQFTEKQLIDFPCQFLVDIDPPNLSPKRIKIPAEIFAFSSVVDFPGVLAPTYFVVDLANRFKKYYDQGQKGYSYIKMYARVKNIKKIPLITERLEGMGLQVESQSDISKKVNKSILIIDTVFFFLGITILILTIIAIFNSYLIIVYHRSHTFSLKRVLGISKIRIVSFFLVEAALVGAIYGFLGFKAGNYLISYSSDHLAAWLPALKGILFQTADFNILLLAIASSIAISVLAAFFPALLAANKNLFKAVRRL